MPVAPPDGGQGQLDGGEGWGEKGLMSWVTWVCDWWFCRLEPAYDILLYSKA